ncbi:CRISPR-associated DxTHG motif protein [Streptomyces sp. NPDC059153]
MTPMRKVLVTAVQNSLSCRILSKLSQPTHSIRFMPVISTRCRAIQPV